MFQVAAIVLVVACCLAGTVFLIAGWRRKWLIQLDPKVRDMAALFHVLAASLFFGMPLLMYCRRLSWPLPVLWLAMTAVAVVNACVKEFRVRRRQRAV